MLHDGFVVRAAGPADAAELGALEAAGRASVVDTRGGAAWLDETRPADWPTVLAGDGHVEIATVDDVPVGFLQMSRPDALGVARVVQVWVHPDAREVGFGDVMLERSIDWARSVGATALEGDALPGDRDTKNLYERAGITARKIVVRTTSDATAADRVSLSGRSCESWCRPGVSDPSTPGRASR